MGVLGELIVEPADRLDRTDGAVDRVAAVLGRAGVGGAALDRDLDIAVPAAGDDRLELGGLGYQRAAGLGAPSEQGAHSAAVLLLVDDRGERHALTKWGAGAPE